VKARWRVTASPVPSFRMLLNKPGPAADLLQAYTSLHDSGRAALFWACRGLGLDLGTWIWMPVLHCGVEVQAAIDAGFNIGFYRLTNELSIDEQDLAKNLIDRPGVVFVIHYFGFAQPAIQRIAALCLHHGCVLIEDCAHALFSRHNGRQLGEFAPIAIFSVHKSLPVSDGGALQVNLARLRLVAAKPFILPPPCKFSLQLCVAYLREATRTLLGQHLTNLYRRFRIGPVDSSHWAPVSIKSFEPSRPYNYGFSPFSRQVAASVNAAAIVEKRRRNYLALDEALSGSPSYLKVFNRLPPDTCPLFLPLWVARRDEFMAELRAERIETFRFGATPHPKLDFELRSETTPLRENIICLPVHDQIMVSDVERIAMIVKPLLLRHALPRAKQNSV
jgi:perosamine synthetase